MNKKYIFWHNRKIIALISFISQILVEFAFIHLKKITLNVSLQGKVNILIMNVKVIIAQRKLWQKGKLLKRGAWGTSLLLHDFIEKLTFPHIGDRNFYLFFKKIYWSMIFNVFEPFVKNMNILYLFFRNNIDV